MNGFRASRIFTEVSPGVTMVAATFVGGESSQTRTFATAFEADAWLDVKRMIHMTGHVSADATKGATAIAALADAVGINLDDWQRQALRAVLAAGPDAGHLIATSDRRDAQPHTNVINFERRAVA